MNTNTRAKSSMSIPIQTPAEMVLIPYFEGDLECCWRVYQPMIILPDLKLRTSTHLR